MEPIVLAKQIKTKQQKRRCGKQTTENISFPWKTLLSIDLILFPFGKCGRENTEHGHEARVGSS